MSIEQTTPTKVQCERCGNVRKNEEDGEIWNEFWYCPECIAQREDLVECIECSTFDLKEHSIPYEKVWDDDLEDYVKVYICHECAEDKIVALFEAVDDEDMMYADIEESYDSETFGYEGQDWLVLTEDEAVERMRQYYGRDFWVMAVQNGNTDDSLEEWQDDVIRHADNIVLSSDNTELDAEIGGTWYHIYKQ